MHWLDLLQAGSMGPTLWDSQGAQDAELGARSLPAASMLSGKVLSSLASQLLSPSLSIS